MNQETCIRAIIFDLGGVLLRTDDPQPRAALAERMGMTRGELEKAVFEHAWWKQAEVGLVSEEEAWAAAARALHLAADEVAAFREQFFAGDRVDFELVALIQGLRPRYTTALLSNTWIADLPGFLRDTLHMPDAFDVIISSAERRVAKPDPAIFQFALEATKSAPHEAIFVDDFERNIAAASALGIRTVHFRSAEQARGEILALLESGCGG